jgi:uncharacterized protein Yka (UPF0111/DUF47 family)
MFGLFGRHKKIFELFQSHGQVLQNIYEEVAQSISSEKHIDAAWLDRIVTLENGGDGIKNAVFHHLSNASLLDHLSAKPLEEGDATALAESIDNIINALKNVATKIYQYNLYGSPGNPYRANCSAYVPLIREAVYAVRQALKALPSKAERTTLLSACDELARIEKQGDILHRQVGKNLYMLAEQEMSARMLWETGHVKEISEILENALDHANAVGHRLRDIVLKEHNQ